jgi:uroporphyrin-III C-methyltransferase
VFLRRESNDIRRGKVYLVGAGPGHPELLTLKAADLLRKADVVVYDRLIHEEVLALSKPSAERIYMGKPLGKHDSRQQEIHELMVRKAREGKLVVRLKGGDPFLFGRGGEEAEYLAAHRVLFDVIPGVSSALAAPLSAGISVTHREASSAVAIVTGHEARKQESLLDWGALAKIETLVLLMGVRNTRVIAQKLIEHGRNPATPAAMIQMAYWRQEKVVTGTLATIADEVEREGIQPPATLVVGKVVRMREKLLRAERDLRRRAEGTAWVETVPPPDQILRLAAAGLGSQVLRFALAINLFDELEEANTAPVLARRFGLNTLALEDLMESLIALGLLERSKDGYRNLELSSLYLRSVSPRSLRPALLYLAGHSSHWEALGRYALNGPSFCAGRGPDEQYVDACESLARLPATAVAQKLDLAGDSPMLVAGWGCEAYREAITKRWPGLDCRAENPFPSADGAPETLGALGQFGAILVSGMLASCKRGQVQKLLKAAADALRRGGLLAFHDSFQVPGALPPPEVVLGGLGRHITRGTCRTWSVERLRGSLGALGFVDVRWEILPAGTVLVTARRAAAP